MKKGFGYFLVELLIVTLGVSISLIMNDRMENHREHKRERMLLQVILNNLQQDSVSNYHNQAIIERFTKSTKSLLNADSTTPLDSFNTYLDHITSYAQFKTVDIGFMELNSSGVELQNDSLYRMLLSYYKSFGPFVEEWNDVQSSYVLEHSIPFVIEEFPKLKTDNGGLGAFAVVEIPDETLLNDRHYHNLLATSLLYNSNMKAVGLARGRFVNTLIEKVREELNKQ